MQNQIVANYKLAAPIAHPRTFTLGSSIALKQLVFHAFADSTPERTVLDVGFGGGDLGRKIKGNPKTSHWHVDGIDGFFDTCCNAELFKLGVYRNVWHMPAQRLQPVDVRKYDLICLLDVIEHLEIQAAKRLMGTLLGGLGPQSLLFVSTPLWFMPQEQIDPEDLEEHKIGVPADSMMALDPVLYHISEPLLVGNFVFDASSARLIEHFEPTADRGFDLASGRRVVEGLGLKTGSNLVVRRR